MWCFLRLLLRRFRAKNVSSWISFVISVVFRVFVITIKLRSKPLSIIIYRFGVCICCVKILNGFAYCHHFSCEYWGLWGEFACCYLIIYHNCESYSVICFRGISVQYLFTVWMDALAVCFRASLYTYGMHCVFFFLILLELTFNVVVHGDGGNVYGFLFSSIFSFFASSIIICVYYTLLC